MSSTAGAASAPITVHSATTHGGGFQVPVAAGSERERAEDGEVEVADENDSSGVFTMPSELDPTQTLRLALPPHDTLTDAFCTCAFAKHLAFFMVPIVILEVILFVAFRVRGGGGDYHLATPWFAVEVPAFLALFTSLQIVFDHWTMREIRHGNLRGLRMSALNDTWWKRIFFFFADTTTLMKKWPLAVLNSLLIPGIPIAAYMILGCAFMGGGGLGECSASLIGELGFTLSWSLLQAVAVITPHYASCANVEMSWNQVSVDGPFRGSSVSATEMTRRIDESASPGVQEEDRTPLGYEFEPDARAGYPPVRRAHRDRALEHAVVVIRDDCMRTEPRTHAVVGTIEHCEISSA